MEIGDAVTFVDPFAKEHNALVTAVHGSAGENPSVNVVYVSGETSEVDQYGRQTKHSTSVVHTSNQTAHGMFWK